MLPFTPQIRRNMDTILGYVKNIFCLYLLMSVLDNLIANDKYKKYIKMFTGFILLAVIIKPVLSASDGQELVKTLTNIEYDYSISPQVQQSILTAEAEKNQEIINTYLSELVMQMNEITREFDLEIQDYDIRINQDMSDENFGNIEMIQLALMKKTEDAITIEKVKAIELGSESPYSGISEAPEIVSIKNKLANFYNISLSNIYISIEERYGY